MARHGNGILGSFSGKVGTVVGSSWNGIPYMRSLPARKKNRRFSEAQKIQQAKFAVVTKFLKPFNPLFGLSFEQQPGMTRKNQAYRQLFTQALSGQYPDFTVALSQLEVARGSLKKADNPAVSAPGAGKLKFTWKDNSGLGNAAKGDKAILVAYCPESQHALFTVNGGDRAGETGELDLAYFSGKEVHTWVSFRSADGLRTADSIYTGMLRVI